MTPAKLKTLSAPFLALLLAGSVSAVAAQTAATTRPSPDPAVTIERKPTAPQVVTVVHRLNGIKVLRLLLHSGAVGAVDTIDESFSMTREVHTNIIAGLALDDGGTIAVWLPEADVELDAWESFAPNGTPMFPHPGWPSSLETLARKDPSATSEFLPELTVISRDGSRLPAQYLGLDGITGLSLLRLAGTNSPRFTAPREAAITINQRVRLFSPEPVSNGRASTPSTISVRIGETDGTIVGLKRGLAGELNRIRISAVKLATANVGGIAVNDAGQTIGIVSGIEGNEAVVLPPSVIRGAAQRIFARKGSVPRPWLGIRGEAVALTPLAGIVRQGWAPALAQSLIENHSGILLTSITPGSPAELAAFRPGDIIVKVNQSEVRSTEDFSLLLEGAGEKPVLFTIVRPDQLQTQSIEVKLGERSDPLFKLGALPGFGPLSPVSSPFIEQGIETFPLLPTAAARRNSSGGLLVIFVQPQSPAFRAGLRPTDIVEAINGQPVLRIPAAELQSLLAGSYQLSVVRNKQKLVLQVNPQPN